jgi:dCTP deaminase
MSVLAGQKLVNGLGTNYHVTPVFDPSQIGFSSVDLRLGSVFILAERSKQLAIDPHKQDVSPGTAQRKLYIPFGGKLVLQPKSFALAATLEYIKLEASVFGILEGRSSPGRTGLIIATAGAVHPGFCGCPTLELVNAGETALILHPGDKVAQLILFSVEDTPDSRAIPTPSRYHISIEPDFSQWYLDVSQDRLLRAFYRTQRVRQTNESTEETTPETS